MTGPVVEPGLIDACRRLAGSATGVLQTRLALLVLEAGDAGERVLVVLLMALAALLCAGACVLALSVWAVFAMWGLLGSAAIGVLAAFYAAAALLLCWWLRERSRAAPPMFGDTLAELRRDAQALKRSSEGGST